jgi:hypothetical protein
MSYLLLAVHYNILAFTVFRLSSTGFPGLMRQIRIRGNENKVIYGFDERQAAV